MKRTKKQKTTICDNFDEFCMNTSLHGLKFVGDKNISYVERIFFGIAFVVGLFISIIYTCEIYDKWNTTPILIGMNPVPTSISDIPFPAVTICNMNMARLSKVKDLNNKSDEYAILQTLCHREEQLGDIPQTKDCRKYESFILNVSQHCKDMFIACEFGTFKENCTEIFHEMVTDEGLCCAFNTLKYNYIYKRHEYMLFFNKTFTTRHHYTAFKWSSEKGYSSKDFPRYYYPRIAQGVGTNMGLSVVLNAEIDEYYCSSSNGAGFKVLLHNPAEAPNIGSLGISVKVGSETRTAINPIMSVASPELKSMKLKYRRCLFQNESKLRFFAQYSERNCEMECESEIMVKQCNCTSYYMPRLLPNVYVCGLDDRECVENVTVQAKQLYTNDTIGCSNKCIPPCFYLTYETDSYSTPIAQGQAYMLRSSIISNMSREYIKDNIAVLHFYYKKKTFRSTTKQEYIGFTDFLSSTGGIIGLFLGSSFISLIEILYYMTLRPICIILKHRIQLKNNSKAKNKEVLFSRDINGRYYNRKIVGSKLYARTHIKNTRSKKVFNVQVKDSIISPFGLPYLD